VNHRATIGHGGLSQLPAKLSPAFVVSKSLYISSFQADLDCSSVSSVPLKIPPHLPSPSSRPWFDSQQCSDRDLNLVSRKEQFDASVQPSVGESWRGRTLLCLAILSTTLSIMACSDDVNAPDDSLANYIPPIAWHGQLSSDFVRSVLKTDGTVWSWGDGSAGALGHGSATSSDIPVQAIGLRGVVAFDQEYGAVVAVDQSGDIWFWGNIQAYLCSPNIVTNVLAPKIVAHLTDVRSISMNLVFTYLLRSDGSVRRLKLDFYSPNVVDEPTKIGGVCGVVIMAKSLAVTGDGRIYDLAKNQFIQESLVHVSAVAGVPIRHALALKIDRTVWAWGANDLGQLGEGTFIDSDVPVSVKGLTNVMQVSAFADYNLALKKDGTAWFWGFEGHQDEQLIGRNTPLKIEGLDDILLACASHDCLVMKRDGTYWSFDVESKIPKPVRVQ
jgi:hypothetical protein